MEQLSDPINWDCKPCNIGLKCTPSLGGMFGTHKECKEVCDNVKCTGSQIFYIVMLWVFIISIIIGGFAYYYMLYKDDDKKMKESLKKVADISARNREMNQGSLI